MTLSFAHFTYLFTILLGLTNIALASDPETILVTITKTNDANGVVTTTVSPALVSTSTIVQADTTTLYTTWCPLTVSTSSAAEITPSISYATTLSRFSTLTLSTEVCSHEACPSSSTLPTTTLSVTSKFTSYICPTCHTSAISSLSEVGTTTV
ncbi:A-agglutinin attachment subunit precursor, partial [Saccharomyces cerevisiae]